MMKNNSKIYELFEGNLSENEKIEIFRMLSENKDLRDEFNYASKLNNSLNENKDNFIIPSGSKEAIFNNLGLSLAGTSTTSSILASKAFVGIVSSVLTFVLMTSIYLYSGFSNNNANITEEISYNQVNKSIQLPNLKSDYLNENTTQIKTRQYDKPSIVKENLLKTKNEFITNNIIPNELDYFEISKSNLALLENVYHNANENENNTYLNKINYNERKRNLTKFYVEFANSVNQNLPQETISPSEIQKFNNNNISIFYILNDRIDVGVDIRNENFFQVYEDESFKYEQTPNFTTYSLSLRYNLYKNFLINDLSFYGNGNIGFNEGGFVSRVGLGMFYELSNGFGFNSNIEYSNLLFQNSFNTFNSHKISINYGIRYNF